MNTRVRVQASRRSGPRRRLASWASLFGGKHEGRSVGRKKAWECNFCGVIGSHRRGCHYVTETHHRGPKPVRRGFMGLRTRATKRGAGARMA